MLSLSKVWENIKPSLATKTFWFSTPEEAIKYIGDILRLKNEDTRIIDNFNDKEINIDDALTLLDDYNFFQSDEVDLELLENNKRLTIFLECWGSQKDCNYYSDVVIFTFNSMNIDSEVKQ